MFMQILDFIVIVMSIIVLRMFHHRDDEEVPGWLFKIYSCLKPIDKFPGCLYEICKICKKSPDDVHDTEETGETTSTTSTDDAQTSTNGTKTTPPDMPEVNPQNWKAVARIMDLFFFYLVLITTIGVVVGCLFGLTVH